VIPAGSGGLPDPAQAQVFATGTFGVVELEIGPDKNLWWADLGGSVHRVTYTGGNQEPVARISANPTSGPVPLAVNFDGRGSSDPVSVTITAGNSPPTAVIDTPAPTRTWTVGDMIGFSGHASDPRDATLPATRLSWSLILHHCATPTDCHTHDVQDFHGVASGSFSAPDHEYPAWIELQLTATDSGGLTDTASVRSTPRRWTSPSAPTRPDCSSRRAAAPPPRRSPAP
jgi:hypothetical protein